MPSCAPADFASSADRQFVALLRLGVIAALQLRFGQIVSRAELLRLLCRAAPSNSGSASTGFFWRSSTMPPFNSRFVKSRLQFQRLAILADGFRILFEQCQRHRQIKVGEIVFGIRLDDLAKCLGGGLVLSLVEGLHALGGVIGLQ